MALYFATHVKGAQFVYHMVHPTLRDLTYEAIEELSAQSGCVIATGGGAVLDPQNVHALRRNGRIYFLDRPIEELLPTEDRPTASTAEAIRQRYEERYDIYCASCDHRIDGDGDIETVANTIIEEFLK